ncbi:MAG: nitroreductase family deazaflavin-dependent oxidoreductase [Halioglobus sp.]|nr:nitroreductase family deazaflavin-dependent oxidoreductase [Halioglobus sp.]MCB1707132.1 nitroreductase family deazaflavin-dependent oxidoreductase [Halioglobus sp.]MCP5122538.1 nitroreductase family deazaflavin-dependent oxidoreductase [Pseudomonadales bacterium]MCP5191705.1 nitroreductase family deazaflavin-dependent oxidoreductase [Pseudomonadales bacterium]
MAENKGDEIRGVNPPKWILKTMSRTHIFLNKLVRGKMFNTLSGDEVCFVTMTGAKSGRSITMPLMYVPYKQGLLLVASMGGAVKNPVWYYNIAKNPDLSVRYRGKVMALRARLATAAEKPDLWPLCDQAYAPYADYRARTSRDIPIFICEPVGQA